MPSCPICNWRRRVLPPAMTVEDEGKLQHPSSMLIMEAENVAAKLLAQEGLCNKESMHKKPPQIWIDILNTEKLCAPTTGRGPNGHRWLRFACRDMWPISSVPSSHFQTIVKHIYDGYGHRIDIDEEGMFTMFKSVRLMHLMQILKKRHPAGRG